VVTIRLPSLRERVADIPVLASHFLKRCSTEEGKPVPVISDEAMHLLSTYSWPGNIRELENVIERAVTLSNQPMLLSEDFPVEVREAGQGAGAPDTWQEGQPVCPDMPTLAEMKRRYVLQVLAHTRGNLSRAAKILAIDRRSLHRMLNRYKLRAGWEEG
jgi:DNA-binding NtrC family response regulator